jgi:anaerobic glycerol-3-phosphate dehydrogenase
MVKATTPPTLAGVTVENAAAAGALVTGQAILAQTSGSS